jgi:hypothetical protein
LRFGVFKIVRKHDGNFAQSSTTTRQPSGFRNDEGSKPGPAQAVADGVLPNIAHTSQQNNLHSQVITTGKDANATSNVDYQRELTFISIV